MNIHFVNVRHQETQQEVLVRNVLDALARAGSKNGTMALRTDDTVLRAEGDDTLTVDHGDDSRHVLVRYMLEDEWFVLAIVPESSIPEEGLYLQPTDTIPHVRE